MSRLPLFLSCLAVLTFGLGLSGCNGPADSLPEQQQPEAAEHEHGDDAGHTHASTEAEEPLGQLSAEDQAAAEKQKTCPVSGELLGSMGTPYKVTVQGSDGKEHEVFLCCKGCEETIKSDPDKYLAKLDE